jgi:hypothetical protein
MGAKCSLVFAFAVVACGENDSELAGKVVFQTRDAVQDGTIRFPHTGISSQVAYRSISVITTGPSLVYGPEDVTYTIEGPDAAEFQHVPGFSWCSFDEAGPQGNASTCQVVLSFRPTTRGAKQAALRVTTPFTDLNTGAMVTRDQTFPIEATAISAPTILFANSTSLYVPADSQIKITNAGTFAVALGGVSVESEVIGSFALQGSDCIDPLAPGASCTATLYPRFGPEYAAGSFKTFSGLTVPLETGSP